MGIARKFTAGGVLALVAWATPASAGGIYVGENGAQAFQRAGAFVAKSDDATAAYTNPAGLIRLTDVELVLGLNVIQQDVTFQRFGTYAADAPPEYAGHTFPAVSNTNRAQVIPSIAVGIPITPKLALGFAFHGPHGAVGGTYPEDVFTPEGGFAPAPQRYDFIKASGIVASPSISVAYRIADRLSIGLRGSVAIASVNQRLYTQTIPNGSESIGLDAVADVSADDWFSPHWGAGLLYGLGDFEIGLNYSSRIRLDLTGESSVELGDRVRNPLPGVEIGIVPVPDAMARCAPGGRVGAIKTCLEFDLPRIANAGVRWIARDENGQEHGDIEFDVRWENWKSVSHIKATIDAQDTVIGTPLGTSDLRSGLKDSWSFRLGAARRIDLENHKLHLRAGVAYDTESASVTWTRVGSDGAPKLTLAAGLGIDIGRFRIDVGGSYIAVPDRVVHDQPIPEGAPLAQRVQPDIPAGGLGGGTTPYNPFNAGRYERSYLLGSIGLSVRF